MDKVGDGVSSEQVSNSNRTVVYQYLQSQMHQGALLPGSVIDLKKISKKLGMSNTPLRDSLIRLEAEGYITIFPRSKVVVNSLELEDFSYLFAMIGTIEYTAIINSLDLYTPEIIDKLENLNKLMQEAIDEGEITLYDKHHYAFHAVFFDISPSIFAERILSPIKNRLWDFPRKNFYRKWYLIAVKEHALIIESLREKNKEKIHKAIIDVHWGYEHNEEFIIKEYNLNA